MDSLIWSFVLERALGQREQNGWEEAELKARRPLWAGLQAEGRWPK